jgi:hypothetical protein
VSLHACSLLIWREWLEDSLVTGGCGSGLQGQVQTKTLFSRHRLVRIFFKTEGWTLRGSAEPDKEIWYPIPNIQKVLARLTAWKGFRDNTCWHEHECYAHIYIYNNERENASGAFNFKMHPSPSLHKHLHIRRSFVRFVTHMTGMSLSWCYTKD